MAGKKNKRNKISFFSKLMLVLNTGAVLALLLCYIAPHVSPDKFWPMIFFGFAYPAILLLNGLFVLYWLLGLKAWLLISLVAILLGWNNVIAYIKIFGSEDIPEQMKRIKVMSFNVRYFDRYSWIHTEKVQTKAKIFELIETESPDVICFQEFYSDLTPDFNTADSLALNYGLPHYHTAYALVKSKSRSYGIATFSRYPIIRKETHGFSNNIYNFAVMSDIVVKADTFRVFNVHFESIRLSDEDRLFINDLTRQVGVQDETVEKYKMIFSKIRFASSLRASQAREIRGLVEASPYPVILCTDLNDTPSSFAYKQLTNKLNDAFVESGKGLGNTYVGFLPAFRIDFILFDPVFTSKAYRTIPDKLSDHHPIVTYLVY